MPPPLIGQEAELSRQAAVHEAAVLKEVSLEEDRVLRCGGQLLIS